MNSPSADVIRHAIRAENSDRTIRAVIACCLGAGAWLLTLGGVFWIGVLVLASWTSSPWRWAGLIMIGFAAVTAWAAVRRSDPLQELRPLSETDLNLIFMSAATPGVIVTSPRHAIAGFAWLLIDGPANVLEGIAVWRSRLPSSSQEVAEAAALLDELRKSDVDRAALTRPRAAALLHRLGLVKGVRAGGAERLTLTLKAQDRLGAAGGPA